MRGMVLAIEAVRSVVEGLRDRSGIVNWTKVTYRSSGLISRHAARAGDGLFRNQGVAGV